MHRNCQFFLFAALAMTVVGCGQKPVAQNKKSAPVINDPAKGVDETTFWKDNDKGTENADPKWGTLRMRFVYGGNAPTPQPVVVNRDEFCAANPPLEETLVVNKENSGLANVVVWLHSKEKKPEVHPSYQQVAKNATLTNKDCRFTPRVITLPVGGELTVHNQDSVGHNAKAVLDGTGNKSFNVTVPGEGESTVDGFEKSLFKPIAMLCTIHPWMRSYLLVQDHPYMAVSDENGAIEIPNLPTGDWTFQAWHEGQEFITQVSFDGETTEWKRGRFKQAIKSGVNDLGRIVVAPQ